MWPSVTATAGAGLSASVLQSRLPLFHWSGARNADVKLKEVDINQSVRKISPFAGASIKYSSGYAILGFIFLSVGIVVCCFMASVILDGDPKGWNGATVVAFPLGGIGMLIANARGARKKLKVLRHGSEAVGTFVRMHKRVQASSQGGTSTTYEYIYKYTVDGEERLATTVTWKKKKAPEETTVLYDPSRECESLVLALEPGGLRLEGSTIKGSVIFGTLILTLPASSIAAVIVGAMMLS